MPSPRHAVTLLLAPAFFVGACSSGGGPEPFEGTAEERVEEVIGRADEAGIGHADADTLLDQLGDDGGSACDHDSPDDRERSFEIQNELFDVTPDMRRLDNIIVSVYCPHLL